MSAAPLPIQLENFFRSGVLNFRTVAIQRQRDFEELFNNFDKMLAVSYVASPDLLLEYLQSKRYTTMELVAGNSDQSLGNMGKEFKQNLKGKMDVIKKLMEYEGSGTLKIYVPSDSRIIHSKLYILSNSDNSSARVIVGSPNFTQTARKSQENYVDCWDLEPNSQLLARYEDDYEKIRSGCILFLEDLRELCEGKEKDDEQEAIGRWLSSDVGENLVREEREVGRLIHATMDASFTNKSEPVLEVLLDSAPHNLRKKITKMLDVDTSNKSDRPQSTIILDALQKKLTRLPLMRIAGSKVSISIDGSVCERSAPLPGQSETVNLALQNIEDYIDTFELGHTNDLEYVKTCCFEAILYIFSAPFSHSYMRMKRQKVGLVDQRGPRYLFIIGPTHNGKTTFLKFAMKMLSGRLIQPLFGEDFKKTRVIQAQATGSVFPLCFDDTKRISEDIVKNYWERWWDAEIPSPQIIVTTNRPLEDWAKSRVIKLNFTTSFDPTMQDRERLNKIFEFNNEVFCWFSHLYLEMLNTGEEEWINDDELYLARTVMQKLYECANRKMPAYFPEKPVEEIYDQDLIEFEYWMKVKNGEMREEASRLTITFAEDMESADVKKIKSLLPPSSNSEIMGKTVVVSDPNAFSSWRKTSPDRRRTAARAGGGWLRRRLKISTR